MISKRLIFAAWCFVGIGVTTPGGDVPIAASHLGVDTPVRVEASEGVAGPPVLVAELPPVPAASPHSANAPPRVFTPTAVIIAPEQGEPGNLVIIRTDGTIGEGHQWVILPTSESSHFLPVLDSAGNHAAVYASRYEGAVVFVLAVAQDNEVAVAVHQLVQGDNPNPPGPQPPPNPVDPKELRVLILEETSDRVKLPSGQIAVLTSPTVRKYLEAKAPGRWRIMDDDLTPSDMTDPERWPAEWMAAYEQAKTTSDGQRPWLLITDGKNGEATPLPDNVDDMMTLLRKYGG